ncbi:Gfo/Idh/MocA family oxidoreductase [Mesorhizobium sp. WSM4303]|uniref:Gfo/Idh/MocA family protein n=1 Tax=unclassified Mesorhizobium TaxID=325217 RepID=UPI00115C970C|nr:MULTISPECIES: Gfo/Idh/MocA family oxidoreductase [unclassified Mesorhizobium]TRC97085.1 Gfo/Idh/MocA family oxidoreductase [Mesorhizobium sp. WSM4306]TRD05327.1 Gfo/Idh/MocA family oxidoreductase [Mesorhizobium sp. WSM4303]
MATLRGALIGCGFFAVNQMHGWRDIDGASIVAICDRDQERLRIVGDQFGIAKRYTDAAALFEGETLDFVDIATTAPSHRALVEMAARYRVPVICQKPFAPTLADAKAMVKACADAGVPLMVHENFRWQSPIQAVRAVLDSGEIGTPFFGRISFRSAYDVFSGQPYLATGKRFIIEDLGIHSLDIARFLLGDVSTITTRTARINPDIAGEDVATMLMDHKGGATSVVDCSYATKLAVEPFPETLIEIDGSDGTIRLAQGYRLTVTGTSGTVVSDVSPPLLPWASRPWHNIQESVVAIQQHWVDCLAKGTAPATSGADNLQTFALVEAAYLGAASREPVQIDALLK